MFPKNVCCPSERPYFPNGRIQNQSVLEIVRWSRDYRFIKTKVFAGDSSILTKLWQKGGRFPIVICNASSPTCLLWRLLVDFQAPNYPAVHLAGCWGAVSPGSQVALFSQGFKSLGLLSACLVESWEAPQTCISSSKCPAAQQTKLSWTMIWVYLSRCRPIYFITSRIHSIPPREVFLQLKHFVFQFNLKNSETFIINRKLSSVKQNYFSILSSSQIMMKNMLFKLLLSKIQLLSRYNCK